MAAFKLASDCWSMPFAKWRALLLGAWKQAGDNNLSLVAAGVAFYAFAAIVPLLASVVLIYGLVADAATVTSNLQALLTVLPTDAAHAIGDQLKTVVTTSDGKKGFGLIVAIGLALYGATKGTSSMVTALNISFEQHETRGFLKLNILALAMVLGAVLMVMTGIITTTLAALLGSLIPHAPGIVLGLIRIVSYAMLGMLVTFGAALLYHFAPSHHPKQLTWLTPGSVLATLLWLAGTGLFGLYASNLGNYGATYGSLSAVIVLLTWLWLSAYVFLLGAELNAVTEGDKDEPGEAAAKSPAAAPASPVSPQPRPAIASAPSDRLVTTALEAKLGGRLTGGQVKLPSALLAGAGLARLRKGGVEGLAFLAGAAALAWVFRARAD